MSSPALRLSLLTVALVALLATAVAPVAARTATVEPPPQDPAPVEVLARGQAAIDRLGRDLVTVAGAHRLEPSELRQLFLADPSLAVDVDGRLVFIDPPAPGEEVVAVPFDPEGVTILDPTEDGEEPPGQESSFGLASLPGADLTIHLDFDGHRTEGTGWNTSTDTTVIVSPPYDLDGDPATWSGEELDAIATAWASVAEDLEPWNVNVTTIEPPVDGLRRSGDEDTRWGARVVVTSDTFARCGCGGLTTVGGFGSTTDEPAFVHATSPEVVAEAITHQIGHLLGLTHDGSTIGTVTHRDLGARPDHPGPDGDGDQPDGDQPDGDRPDGDQPDGDRPGGDQPDGDGPGTGVDTEPPAAPVGAIGVDLGGTVFLGWVPNGEDDLAGYVVRWSAEVAGPTATIATTVLNGHVDDAPVAGDNRYLIQARDTSGNLSAPTELTVRVVSDPVTPVVGEST